MDIIVDPFVLLIYPLCLVPLLFLLWAAGINIQKHYDPAPRGCKKLGLSAHSNILDEYDPKYSKPTSTSTSVSPDDHSTEPCRIKALFIHPIKSCAPVELDTADLSYTGMTWDRQFCFAEYIVPMEFPPGTPQAEKRLRKWTFRTLRQRGYERLVHVRPEIWLPDTESVRINQISRPNLDGVLVIYYPNLPQGTAWKRFVKKTGQSLHLIPKESSFSVPLNPPKNHTYPLERISIWRDITLALDYGRHVPADFKTYLQVRDDTPFTLFRASPAHQREIHLNAPHHGTAEGQDSRQSAIAFPDSYPLHLLNLASVRDVGDRVKHEIPRLSAKRFRPNILVTGPRAYEEDGWKSLRVHPRRRPSSPSPSPSPPSPSPSPPSPPQQRQHNHQNQHQYQKPSSPQPQSVEKHDVVDAFSSPSTSPSTRESVDLYCACPTTRCRLPNVDPETGLRHPNEPDKTMRSYRCIDPDFPTKATLGLQLIPALSKPSAAAAGRGGRGGGGGGGAKTTTTTTPTTDDVLEHQGQGQGQAGGVAVVGNEHHRTHMRLKVGDEIEVLARFPPGIYDMKITG